MGRKRHSTHHHRSHRSHRRRSSGNHHRRSSRDSGGRRRSQEYDDEEYDYRSPEGNNRGSLTEMKSEEFHRYCPHCGKIEHPGTPHNHTITRPNNEEWRSLEKDVYRTHNTSSIPNLNLHRLHTKCFEWLIWPFPNGIPRPPKETITKTRLNENMEFVRDGQNKGQGRKGQRKSSSSSSSGNEDEESLVEIKKNAKRGNKRKEEKEQKRSQEEETQTKTMRETAVGSRHVLDKKKINVKDQETNIDAKSRYMNWYTDKGKKGKKGKKKVEDKDEKEDEEDEGDEKEDEGDSDEDEMSMNESEDKLKKKNKSGSSKERSVIESSESSTNMEDENKNENNNNGEKRKEVLISRSTNAMSPTMAPFPNTDSLMSTKTNYDANLLCHYCGRGMFKKKFTYTGLLASFFCFPCGILFCFMIREKVCTHCGAHPPSYKRAK